MFDKSISMGLVGVGYYQIAYEIRLQQAMEEEFLCSFHYFGISDVSFVDEKKIKSKKITEKELYAGKNTEQEMIILEYLSKTVLSGARPYELEILKCFLHNEVISVENMNREFQKKYGYTIDMMAFENAVKVL